ncbi:glycerol-3-phosphate dehydrogenase/oxidase [Algicola sagamiensis]|uniref:glycerol-3-phosphate dehydrogenase/oxidase n=1 Tax=Algicola sagamiensis TaxID=163869 RepID=UPI000366E610|nr:glycerol-3-phosphate dehydrogenase/oxidase [Algicola sagamiensis]
MKFRTITQAKEEALASLNQEKPQFDAIIIGGGVTGAGIFHAATENGLNVLLVEQKDFAWGTSSRSSKMVHGGLRYFAAGNVSLTRHAVSEREYLLNKLPGLVEKLPYVMVHKKGEFPPPSLFGLLVRMYYALGGLFHLPKQQRSFSLRTLLGLQRSKFVGFSNFYDAITDDARLVIRLLQEGASHGGKLLNYAPVEQLIEEEGIVKGVLLNMGGQMKPVYAAEVINATGAWATRLHSHPEYRLRPLRGSHLLLPFHKLPLSASLTVFHPKDKRPIFVYPWEGCAVIGTTDLDDELPQSTDPSITDQEVEYLLEVANSLFEENKVNRDDILSTWAGFRPVFSTDANTPPSKEKRDHAIWQRPGLISISGGKLTTFAIMAQEVLEAYRREHPSRLGDLQPTSYSQSSRHSCALKRLQGRYGNAACAVSLAGQNQRIHATNTLWSELNWALQSEAVCHLEDLLLRRTRLGNLIGPKLKDYESAINGLLQKHLGWSETKIQAEWENFWQLWQQSYRVS